MIKFFKYEKNGGLLYNLQKIFGFNLYNKFYFTTINNLLKSNYKYNN